MPKNTLIVLVSHARVPSRLSKYEVKTKLCSKSLGNKGVRCITVKLTLKCCETFHTTLTPKNAGSVKKCNVPKCRGGAKQQWRARAGKTQLHYCLNFTPFGMK